ncbi:MAG: efflux RND transporter periplasmic adaptor subunit [Candidatus Acidiferrales bacterium]
MYISAVVVLVPLVTWGLSRLKPAPPTVDGSVIWAGPVKRGDMLLEVRGLGTLIPETITQITRNTDGRVSKRLILPGALVKADSVIMVLTNPTLDQQLLSARYQLKSAEATLTSLQASVGNTLMGLRSSAANVESNYRQAEVQAEADEAGYKFGVVAKVNSEKSQVQAVELKAENDLAQKQVEAFANSVQSQLAVQQAIVSQDKAQVDLYQREVDDLTVRAGIDGVLQDEPAQVGQDMVAGSELATVAQQSKLKAALQIAETQVGDVRLNQTASIDTHNGIISGHVIRIDPAVANGTRTVDVHLDGPLPEGAVPNSSVEGTILLEKLTNVLYVDRPVHAEQNSPVGLFKESPDGREAELVNAEIGKTSVSTVEILKGLNVGDVVILSDMSAYENFQRIRISK